MKSSKIIFLVAVWISFHLSAALSLHGENQYKKACVFQHPEPVAIKGLPMGFGGTPISTEEPFLSRDGKFLFFNSHQKENNKDLHYARKEKDVWIYQGEIGPGVNSKKEVQGNPTMDRFYNFYYIDSSVTCMVRTGTFSKIDGTLSYIRDLQGIPKRNVQLISQKFHGNMGVEVSKDGSVIYFSRATWDMNGFAPGEILESDILFIKRTGGRYAFDKAESERIMAQINSTDLDYAASISADGLELFFTRLAVKDIQPGKIRSTILRATRTSLTAPFDAPRVIEAIGREDFVEGPAISADEKELYYHKLEGNKFRLYRVTRRKCR